MVSEDYSPVETVNESLVGGQPVHPWDDIQSFIFQHDEISPKL